MLQSTLADLIPATATTPNEPRIEVTERSGGHVIAWGPRIWAVDVPREEVADGVVWMLLRRTLEVDSDRVHIHAGAVAKGSHTVVLAGVPGSGKSTAIAGLLQAGFDYLTDERLSVEREGAAVESFPKPISLVEGSFSQLAHLDPKWTGVGASTGSIWQLPASSLGPGGIRSSGQPSVIVFVRFVEDVARASVSPVEVLDAAGRLVVDSPDVIDRGIDGVETIVRLCESTRCVELRFGSLAQAVEQVIGLTRTPVVASSEPMTMIRGDVDASGRDAVAELDLAACYGVARGIAVWMSETSTLVYNESAGQMVELDPTSAAWLQLLDEATSIAELIGDVAAEAALSVEEARSIAIRVVGQLLVAGVIAQRR